MQKNPLHNLESNKIPGQSAFDDLDGALVVKVYAFSAQNVGYYGELTR